MTLTIDIDNKKDIKRITDILKEFSSVKIIDEKHSKQLPEELKHPIVVDKYINLNREDIYEESIY